MSGVGASRCDHGDGRNRLSTRRRGERGVAEVDSEPVQCVVQLRASEDGAWERPSEVNQLREALKVQQVIGAATGLLANRFGWRTEEAFGVLVRLSQHTNVKVRVVARVLVAAFDGDPALDDAPLLTVLVSQLPGARLQASTGSARR